MEQKPQAVKPLTPDTFADKGYYRPVDVAKYLPWLKDFKQHQPPADQKIEVREETKK